jgi:hypothetical protein
MQETISIMFSLLMVSVIGGVLGWSITEPFYYANNPEELDELKV